MLLNPTPRSLVEPLSIHPINPASPAIQSYAYTYTHQLSTTISACLPPPILRGFCQFLLCFFGENLLYLATILHYPSRFTHFVCSRPPALLSFSFSLTFRASHEDCAFRVRVERTWVETVGRAARLNDVLVIARVNPACMYVIWD